MKKCNLLWSGAMADPSGYGEASRNYVKQLSRYDDVNLRVIPKTFWMGESINLGEDEQLFKELEGTAFISGLPLIVIQNLTPENYKIMPSADRHVCLTTFETDSVPSSWIIPIRAMDEVWTYTQFNKETFRNANITNPIHVIPHGVDEDRFNPEVLPLEKISEMAKGRFVFGSVFDWVERKNPDILIEAFITAFAGVNSSKVCMVVKSFCSYNHVEYDFMKKKIREIRASVQEKIGDKQQPSIFLIAGASDVDFMPQFYASLDAFALCSSGEGWGLIYTEAMASGLPVIATEWSGNLEFMNRSNSYLVKSSLVKVRSEDCKKGLYVGHKWASISMKDVAAKMKYIFSHKKAACNKGKKARKDVVKKWTWKQAGEKLHENILRIADELSD